MPLQTPEEVLTSKVLVAEGPLDGKTVVATLVERDNIPTIQRYQGMQVFVQEDEEVYILNTIDLTNTGWFLLVPPPGQYLGYFDPANPPANPPMDGDMVNFVSGDTFLVEVAGYWNFTTGDQSPDSGGQNVANLLIGDTLRINPSFVWDVTPSTDLVTSVNGKQGAIVLDAADIGTDPIAGMTQTQTQEALEELKGITDGLSTGSIYFGAFDPTNPPANPPTDGDTVNYNQGDFYITSVAGFWNFTLGNQTPDQGGQNVANLSVGDSIRFNKDDLWDVIASVITEPGGSNTNIQFNNNGAFEGSPLLLWNGAGVDIIGTSVAEKASLDALNGLRIFDLANGVQSARLSGISGGELLLQLNGSTTVKLNGQDGTLLLTSTNATRVAEFSGTTSIILPVGTVAQRPTGAAGMLRFNNDDNSFEGYDGTEWGAIGGGVEPGGLDTNIQFNDGGLLGGETAFTFDKGTDILSVGQTSVLRTEVSPGNVEMFNDSNQSQIRLIQTGGSGFFQIKRGGIDIVNITGVAGGNTFFESDIPFGIGTNVPVSTSQAALTLGGTKSLIIPSGTVLQRPSAPQAAMLRFNTDNVEFEGYNGTEWGAIGGAAYETQTISHAADGVLTIDFANGAFAIVNLSANVTSITISGDDGEGKILFVQDATGGRVVDFTGIETIDAALPDYSTVANAKSLMTVTKANGSVYMLGQGNMIAV